CPASPRVGNRHCALVIQGHRVFIQNHDTITGTFVNDRRIDGMVQVFHGDWLKIGPLLFRLNIEVSSGHSPQEDMAAALLLLEEQDKTGTDTAKESKGASEGAAPPPADEPAAKPLSPAAKAILEKYRHRRRGW